MDKRLARHLLYSLALRKINVTVSKLTLSSQERYHTMNEVKKNDQVLSPDQQFSAITEKKVDLKKTPASLNILKADLQSWLNANADVMATHHKTISDLWAGNKDRNLATVESAVRGILADIGRLSESLPKLGTDKISSNGNPYAVSKPR